MLRKILLDSLEGNALDEGYLKAFYSFNSYSGAWNFNEKYNYPSGITLAGDASCPNLEYLPAYQVSCLRSSFNANCADDGCSVFSGAGHFDGTTVLRVGGELSLSDWTVFINFESSGSLNTPALGKNLVTSMQDTSSPSGFAIGINGANKLYYEHFNKHGVIDTVTLNAELGAKNVISVSKDSASENVELIYHDKVHGRDTSALFLMSDAVDEAETNHSFSKHWYLGDHFNPSPGYTGYSGCMFDFVLFSTPLSSSVKKDLASAFFSKDYSGKRTVWVDKKFKVIRGDPDIEIIVTGTGITGYENISHSLPVRCPDTTINTCVKSGVTGELSGQMVNWGFSEEEVSLRRPAIAPAEYFYCEEYVESYGKDNIVFVNNLTPIDSFDAYEIYKYDDIKTNLNKEGILIDSSTDSTTQSATSILDCSMNLTINDKMITPMSGGNVNFYVNGLAQRPKIDWLPGNTEYDYEIVHEETVGRRIVLNAHSFVADFGQTESRTYSHHYDEILGAVFVSGYSGSTDDALFIDEDGAAAHAGVSNQNFVIGKDIHINGKKLISGVNYSAASNNIPTVEIDRSSLHGLETGEMLFTPIGNYDLRVTGKDTTVVSFDSNIISEQVWLNGKKEKQYLGYYKTINNSLLTYNSTIVPHREFVLFGGSEAFFS